jgi:hypothetical protein
MFANDPQKRRVAAGIDARGFAVDGKGNRRHETSPSFGARADMALFVVGPRSIGGAVSLVRISDAFDGRRILVSGQHASRRSMWPSESGSGVRSGRGYASGEVRPSRRRPKVHYWSAKAHMAGTNPAIMRMQWIKSGYFHSTFITS